MAAKKYPTIGVRNLVVAQITEDTTTGYETYGTPTTLSGAIEVGLTVESNDDTTWADDIAYLVDKSFSGGSLSLNVIDIGNANAALLLGQTIDSNGVREGTIEDIAPSFAVGFVSRKFNGADRYVWLYRVTFASPSETYHTIESSKTKQLPTIEGTFVPRVKPDSNGKHPYRTIVDSDDTSVSSTVISNWFTAPYEPNGSAQG
jgi:phi13 family phage major tail protein